MQPLSSTAHLLGKSTDMIERGLAERHVGTDKIPDRPGIRGQASMAASDNPQELLREPTRPATEPVGSGHAPNAIDALIGVWCAKRVEPAIEGNGIVIKKYYN